MCPKPFEYSLNPELLTIFPVMYNNTWMKRKVESLFGKKDATKKVDDDLNTGVSYESLETSTTTVGPKSRRASFVEQLTASTERTPLLLGKFTRDIAKNLLQFVSYYIVYSQINTHLDNTKYNSE